MIKRVFLVDDYNEDASVLFKGEFDSRKYTLLGELKVSLRYH